MIHPSSTEVHVTDAEPVLVIDDTTTPTGVKEDGRITYSIINIGPGTAYLGASDVADTNGYPLANGAACTISIRHKAHLYAICASGDDAYLRILVVP